jgi:hypothetical protein
MLMNVSPRPPFRRQISEKPRHGARETGLIIFAD